LNALKPHVRTTIATLLQAGKGQREIARLTEADRKAIAIGDLLPPGVARYIWSRS